MRLLIPSVLAALLAACGLISDVDETPPPKPGMSQLIFQRTGSAIVLGDAEIQVNNQRVASLGLNRRAITDVPPGHTIVSVSGLPVPGVYTIEFDAGEAKVYYFRIGPRGDTMRQLGPDFHVIEAAGAYRLSP